MNIKDVMTKKVAIVTPETLLHEVAKKMQAGDYGSVLVGQNDRLLGIITDRDLALRCIAESHHPETTTAERVMTKQILYCYEDDTVEDVALNMARNKVRRLPVIDKRKRLVGIVSLGDLASHSTDEHHRACGSALGVICAPTDTGQRVESQVYNA
jgi:CBS domain-containing protein